MGSRLLLAALVSWLCSVTLGLWFAAWYTGRFRPEMLGVAGTVPIALMISTAGALLITPLAAWSARTGLRNLRGFVPTLWLVLAAGIVLGIGVLGTFVVALAGVTAVGFVPPRDRAFPSGAA
jgi:hypothetical protein